MVLKKINQFFGFFKRAVDLKKNVSIYTRKQTGQERKGISAC